jgi:hypothetical protein
MLVILAVMEAHRQSPKVMLVVLQLQRVLGLEVEEVALQQ